MMNKVHKLDDSERYTLSSERFTFYLMATWLTEFVCYQCAGEVVSTQLSHVIERT
jgi:hypothetical protein